MRMGGVRCLVVIACAALAVAGCGSHSSGPVPTAKSKIASGACSLAVKKDGSLWAWGDNESSQLGLGTVDVPMPPKAHPTPTRVGTASDWAAVASGDTHSLARKTDGTLWAWGMNDRGQLGLGDFTNRKVPTRIGTAEDWAAVVGGGGVFGFSLALKQDGTLWAWGDDQWGQLGLGNHAPRRIPTPTQVGADWAAVASGGAHVLALKTDGSLWTWGDDQYGQLGLGGRITNGPTQVGTATDWAAVACGFGHSLAVNKDGTLWAWGWNSNGQLGLGDTENRNTPTRVGTSSDWAVVAGGADYTVALKTDGSLWAWGDGEYGELGLGDTRDRHTPTRVGTAHDWASIACYGGLALKTDGSLWAWGANEHGELGLGDTTNRDVPTRVPGW